MPTAQDHAFALLVAQRGVVSPDALAQARALVERSGGGQTLAQVLLEGRVLGPAAVAEALRELARSSFVCAPCHEALGYDALARLAALQCPSCGRALSIVPTAPRDSRLTHTLGDTAAGSFAGAFGAAPHVSRASGAHALPSGAFSTLGAAEPPAGEGRTIGPYQVVRELGRGSNGVVFLARRPGLQRNFAVKVLREQADPEAVRRFQQEATLASKIDDPGIIPVFDVGRHGNHDYYAMDFCPGVTLEERLKRGAMPPAEAARVVERLARTVEAAHRKQVIHRDLKPANVILEEGSGRPRILDFGLARDRTQDQKLTRSGDVLGTPYYMAPEQIRGDRDIDHRIDVYALGVILYECLTGRRPFEASTVIELAHKIRAEEPPRPRAVQPRVPEALEAICLRAMAKDRAVRHPTARSLADDLAGRGAAAPPRHVARPRRPRWLWALALGAAASAALGAVALVRRPGTTPPPTTPPPSPPPSDDTSATAAVRRHLERGRALARERASDAVVLAELDGAERAAGADALLLATVRLERAGLLSRRGKHDEATALAAALADDGLLPAGQRAEALRVLAHGRERLGDPAAARQVWARLAEADAGAPGAVARTALVRLDGDQAAHRERAAEAARAHPAYPPALLERATAELLAGDAEVALAVAREASAAWPDDVMAHLVVGLAAVTGGDRVAARAAFDDAIRLAEPAPDLTALTSRARLQADEGRLDSALADVDRVLARAPDDLQALVLRGVVLWSLAAISDGDQRRAQAEAGWRRAHAVDQDLFLRLVETLSPQVRAAARQAAGVSPQARPGERAPLPLQPETRARLERRAHAAPEPARRPLLLALVAAAEGQPLPRFEAWLREAAAAAPDSARVALLEARLREGRDDYERALEAVERARELGASEAALDLLQGEVLWFRGKGNDAVKVWDALARRSPTDPHGLCAAAWAFMARDEHEAAIAAAAEALRKAPELASALVVQGMSHENELRFAEAERCFERVLALEGAIYGRVPLFELDAELSPLVQAIGWRGRSTPEIDARFERLESLFGLGGATTRLVAVDKALALGPGTRWFERCHAWLEEGQRLEPGRAELDMWRGWVSVNDPRSGPDEALGHWLRAQEKDPRVVLSKGMREQFRRRFGDRAELERFPER